MTAPRKIPMVSYLALDDGAAHLVGQRCTHCGAIFFDRRNGCASCGETDFAAAPLASDGTLLAFTIVHRAAPKVPVPYISAVVQLDGGGVIKANLVGVPSDPAAVDLGGRVHLTTFVAATDDDGNEAIGFGFTPAAAVEA
jgi:uncharacterized OB-fold protein